MKNNDLIETRNDIVFSQIEDIKKDIFSTRNKILTDANKELINMYFRIGKIISENQKYGSNYINSLSTSLKIEFPDTTGFSPRNLARMRKFYETYKDLSNLPTALAKLPWSFNNLLIDRIGQLTSCSANLKMIRYLKQVPFYFYYFTFVPKCDILEL